MFFGFKKKKIESFDIISFHTSGMRSIADYEMICKDGKARITQYHINHSDNEKERVVDRQAECDADEIIKLLNDCGIMSWNGFHGKHPRGIKDGVMFRFDAKVNGDTNIHADGSQNFPKHYRDFTDWLYGILNKKENKTVYKDGRYTLGTKDGAPYLNANGKEYKLTCHPYEPCLYITDENGGITAVHNSFDPVCTLEAFADGGTVTSITGCEYTAEDFCRMVEYAAGMYDIQIDDAEKIFGGSKNKKKETAAPPKEKVEAFDKYPADPAYDVIEEYPDIVIDYCIVKDELPYNGYNSHWSALAYACRKMFSDEEDGWHYNVGKADAKKIGTDTLFARINETGKLNYRHAFLHPPYETNYTDDDFDRVNNALFPNGTEPLEVYEWTTDWSDYFDEGHEWWGTLCCTVYDKSLDRYVIILASATD